jgi:Uma2 family endonuclease
MAPAVALLTADEYAALPNDGRRTELVRGVVVALKFPLPRHGQICTEAVHLLQLHLETHPIGRTVGRSAFITGRNPDTVRGPDICFYSYSRMPRGRLPQGYLPVPPDLIFEVRSPSEPWGGMYRKAGEYLNSGATLVCVLDQETETAYVIHDEKAPRIVSKDEELTLPEVLPDFRVPVRRFFE